MTIICVSLTRELLEKLDEYVELQGYTSRSEAIRDAIRGLLTEFELSKYKKGKVVATIAILYNYERVDADEKLCRIRREFDALVTNDLHAHLGGKYCLELIIAEGEVNEIEKLIRRIRAIRGILSVKYSVLPVLSSRRFK